MVNKSFSEELTFGHHLNKAREGNIFKGLREKQHKGKTIILDCSESKEEWKVSQKGNQGTGAWWDPARILLRNTDCISYMTGSSYKVLNRGIADLICF